MYADKKNGMPLDMQSTEKSTCVETHVLGAETGRQISWQDETSPSRIDCVEYVAFQVRFQAHMVMPSPMVENTYS